VVDAVTQLICWSMAVNPRATGPSQGQRVEISRTAIGPQEILGVDVVRYIQYPHDTLDGAVPRDRGFFPLPVRNSPGRVRRGPQS